MAPLPAAVSTRTAHLLAGRPVPVRVLGVFPTAVYVGLPGAQTVLPLLTTDALLLPTGLRLAAAARELDWPVGIGQAGTVGEGALQVGALVVRGVRTWTPRSVAADGSSVPLALERRFAEAQGRAGPELTELADRLVTAAREGRSSSVAAIVSQLVGAGRGLTPSGDDTLCGVLLALAARPGHDVVRAAVWSAVRSLLRRTTDLSATLLAEARDGYAVPEVVGLVTALAQGDAEPAEHQLARVLAIGHSSGRDLVAGLAGALRALAVSVHAAA